MKARFFFLLIICNLFFLYGRSQRVIEVGIKPLEWIWANTEVNVAIGNKKARYGIFLSYRPSTKDSGEVKDNASGAFGGYRDGHFNKLHNTYSIGLYQKTYITRALDLFVETDIFYRNSSLKNKLVRFKDSEKYWFEGRRTENIDTYGLKLLLGKTFMLSPEEDKLKWYIDLYAGFGVRRLNKTYETYDGYVRDEYYDYKKEKFQSTIPSAQAGVKFGIMIGR